MRPGVTPPVSLLLTIFSGRCPPSSMPNSRKTLTLVVPTIQVAECIPMLQSLALMDTKAYLPCRRAKHGKVPFSLLYRA